MQTQIEGKGMLPMAGEYTGGVVRDGVNKFVRAYRPDVMSELPHQNPSNEATVRLATAMKGSESHVHPRPPSFCTGCPERPIFTALKLVERELGPHHVSCDIGCHLFSILPPFNIGATTMGYGLGGAGAAAFNTKSDKRAIAFVGDGGFWHNGLTSSIGNAVFNKSDNVTHHRGQRLHLGDRRAGHSLVLQRQQRSARRRTRSRRRCAASASNGCAR